MLYMTTLSSHNTYTSHRALTEEISPDGGLFVPFVLPVMDSQQLKLLPDLGCCGTIALILNQFFSVRLSEWDVSISIGRNPIKFNSLGRTTLIADAWGNPGGSYAYAVSSLNNRILNRNDAPVSGWTHIAIGIAYAFGVYAELCRCKLAELGATYDVCVPDGELSQLTAMLYARKMGLPIGKIVICANGNGAFWDLVNHGKLNVSQIPQMHRSSIQRLIHAVAGQDCVTDYIAANGNKTVYNVTPEQQALFAEMLFPAVISNERVHTIVENVGASIAPDTAICYAGLQDYRSKTGQGKLALMIGYTAPN